MARRDRFSRNNDFFGLPLAGCLEDEVSENRKIVAEELTRLIIHVHALRTDCSVDDNTKHGVDRYFRNSSIQKSEKLPIVLAFHGGGGAEEDFPQQNEFDALAEQEKFIMAYVISEDGRTESEGEWFLSSAATSEMTIYSQKR